MLGVLALATQCDAHKVLRTIGVQPIIIRIMDTSLPTAVTLWRTSYQRMASSRVRQHESYTGDYSFPSAIQMERKFVRRQSKRSSRGAQLGDACEC